jgi:hypothetical protein
MSTHPLSAINKDTSDLELSSSASPKISRKDAVMENTAIFNRNAVRESRRKDPSHYEPVEDDEDLLDLDNFEQTPISSPKNSRPSSPFPVLGGVAATMNSILKLTPRSKKAVIDLLNQSYQHPKSPNNISVIPRVLYSSADERPIESRVSNSFRVHPDLITLAEAKQHIPLTMFTSMSTEKLWRDCASL